MMELTCPVILMRMGGLDGVALQKMEYSFLLNDLDISVHAISGREETEFGGENPDGHQQTLIPELDFYHKDSLSLFANQFEEGSEKNGVDDISDEEWHRLFEQHKRIIKEGIAEVIESIPHNTPVLVYNLLALRHAQPAAAAAMKEIIEENPNRGFLSHAADPDAERPEKINRIKTHCLPALSCNPEGEPYSGGPYNMNNLYHIVLNPVQHANFIAKYAIPKDHVFEIPDFINFKSKTPFIQDDPSRSFLEFIADKAVCVSGDSYEYRTQSLEDVGGAAETVCFLSPVRPVYRKRVKEAMLVAKQYGLSRGVPVAFAVTHPNLDDRDYFQETVEFAQELDLPYYHFGEEFMLETLDFVYDNMASMKTVGVVASSAGGWENALNEMAHSCIPFFMSNSLNSYKPITEKIGIITHGTDFIPVTSLIDKGPIETLKTNDLSSEPELHALFEWIDSVLVPTYRREVVSHNYTKAYKYLSHKATAPRLMEAILYIYARHGLPGQPGVADEPNLSEC